VVGRAVAAVTRPGRRQGRDRPPAGGLPATEAAAVDGTIGAGQAQVAAQAARDLPAGAAEGLDRLVVETGSEGDPGRLRAAVDDHAHRTRPASLAARQQRAWRARRLTLSRTADGAVAIDGRLDPVGGEAVLTALAPLAAPTAGDTRTPEQRRADALVTLSTKALDDGRLPEVGGVRPHVTVVVPLETLQGRPGSPPAVLDRGGAISADAARALACDSAITQVITTGASQPLDLGRATRVVSVAQRRALAVRDGGCVGCRAPAAWSQAHHAIFRTDHGPTDLDNLILVCWRCHHNIHERHWQPIRAPNGHWSLHPPRR
jgi:uncharacterized protein DUF222/HNH endonuclease